MLALLLAIAAASVIAATAATGQGGLARIGAAPRLPRGSVEVGSTPSTAHVSGEVVLRPRNEAALQAFIQAATSKGSRSFGEHLARGQFAGRFGPAASSIAAVRAALAQAGLQATATASEPLLVRFSGSAAAADRAFATSLRSFRTPGDDRVARATASAPALPARVAASVAAVLGLDELPGPHPMRVRRLASLASRFPAARAVSFKHPPGSPRACADARADATEFGGLTDDQIAYAYGAFGLYALGDTGAGVHIGVFEQEPFSSSDLQHFDSCYFGAAAASAMQKRLQVVALEGGIPQGPGSYGEALLDVEDVSAMAPGADIDVYENPETAGTEVAEIAAMVDEDRDQIITSSYGQACEQEEEEGQPGTQQALNFLFQQAAAQGQSFLGAAGDSGSDSCEEVNREAVPQPGQNPISAGEIASQPYVIGVGGTTITAATQPVQEHVWNDGPSGGAGGGGISQSFAMPSWQRDATLPGIDLPGSEDYENAAGVEKRFGYPTGFCQDTFGAGVPCRLEPDVSAQSDEYTGAVTIYSSQYRGEGEEQSPDGWITTGGTSSGTPIWAGMLALASASPTCREDPATASGLGFILPLLYGVASNPSAYAASFNDVTAGDNDQYGLDEGKVFPARPGFDLASGLGSPRLTGPGGSAGLAYYLCSYAGQATRPVLTELSPAIGPTAGGELVKVTGINLEDAAGVQVGSWEAPPSAFHVAGPSALALTMPPARETLPANAPPSQDGSGPVQILVTLRDGQSSAPGPGSTFDYVDASGQHALPSVTGVLPSGGSEASPQPVAILGSGFDGASGVSFGGVPAASYTVLSNSQIRATPPAYSARTACAPLPSSGVYAGESAADDVCQAQVLVDSHAGASAAAKILPPLEGALSFEQDGAAKPPPGCGCEVYPATTEYDYAPPPQISSVSSSQGPGALAAEQGGTLITIHGAGLGLFTFEYASFGEAQLESSVDAAKPVFTTGTEIQMEAPPLAGHGEEPTLQPQTLPLSVRTLAGSSSPASVEYAGVPRVSAVINGASALRLHGLGGAVDTGGAPLALKGKGLAGQVALVRFEGGEGFSEGTQYTLHEGGEDELFVASAAENPSLVQVQACTVTGCSTATPLDQLYLYPPGQPAVEALRPSAGPARGGTKVLVSGANLDCPLAVSFGSKEAESFAPTAAGPCDQPGAAVDAVSPPAARGSEVPVRVTTWESYFTESGDAPSNALFRYR